MKNRTALVEIGFFTLVIGCSGSGANDDLLQQNRADRVILDVRCSADADCPSGFECEVEHEHGTATSYCKSHPTTASSKSDAGAGASACPAGFEQETEHGGTFCKPHGGGDDSNASTSRAKPSGAACASDTDCAPGLECESEVEHGEATSFCKPHGGGKKGGKN